MSEDQNITLYDYKDFFKELAAKIVAMGQDEFRQVVKESPEFKDSGICSYGDQGIDPLSLFSLLTSGKKYISQAKEIFNIESNIPTDNVYPSSNPQNMFFYSSLPLPGDYNPNACWEVLVKAQKGEPLGNELFKTVLKIRGTAVSKLTAVLFLIDSDKYFTFDSKLYNLGIPGIDKKKEEEEIYKKEPHENCYDNYCNMLEKIREYFPKCHFTEVNRFAYSSLTKDLTYALKISNNYFQIDLKADEPNDRDYMEDFYENNHVWVGHRSDDMYPILDPDAGDIMLVRNGDNGLGIAVVRENEYKQYDAYHKDARIKVVWINKEYKNTILNNARGRGLPEAHDDGIKSRFEENYQKSFKILENVRKNQKNTNEEQAMVHEQKNEYAGNNTPKYALNTILYGPPGTGKTYETTIMAAEILKGKEKNIGKYKEAKEIFEEGKNEGRVEFITFHQSYSYEDFIQGIKPKVDDDDENDDKKGELSFAKVDGVFKRIADRARKNWENSKKTENNHILNVDKLIIDFAESVCEKIDAGEEFGLDGKVTIARVEEKGNWLTFYTGGSVNNQSLVSKIITRDIEKFIDGDITRKEDIPPSQKSIRTYHGNASYLFMLYKKIKEFYEENQDEYHISKEDIDPLQNYVIIIDEINRANVSKVFGELITLIEEDKRLGKDHEMRVTLPLGDEDFVVPPNLYIIGTMNTADKSIALLDVALRRRFEFIAKYPKSEIKGVTIHNATFLQALNEEIKKSKGIDFQIGHSYFMASKNENKNENEKVTWDFKTCLYKKVIPLLLEYYRNDEKEVTKLLENTLDKSSEDNNKAIVTELKNRLEKESLFEILSE